MSYNFDGKVSKVLYAVIGNGGVLWTRGGSSSTPRLMVYESRDSAERALKNYWIRQALKHETTIVEIWKAQELEVFSR